MHVTYHYSESCAESPPTISGKTSPYPARVAPDFSLFQPPLLIFNYLCNCQVTSPVLFCIASSVSRSITQHVSHVSPAPFSNFCFSLSVFLLLFYLSPTIFSNVHPTSSKPPLSCSSQCAASPYGTHACLFLCSLRSYGPLKFYFSTYLLLSNYLSCIIRYSSFDSTIR